MDPTWHSSAEISISVASFVTLKVGNSPSRSLEIRTFFTTRSKDTFFITADDIKNWSESDPAKLVGEYVMAHFAGDAKETRVMVQRLLPESNFSDKSF